MPWAAGVYTRGYPSWSNDAASNLPISATKFDTEDNDFAAGLNNTLTKDSLSAPSGAISWGLASAQILALTRGGDGAIFSVGRTGGTNNPVLTFNAVDASGITASTSFGTLNFTKSADGTVIQVSRTGGVNNPQLSASVTDATGVGLASSFGSLALTTVTGSVSIASAGNVTVGAPSSGDTLTIAEVSGGNGITVNGPNGGTSSGIQVNQGTGAAGPGINVSTTAGRNAQIIVSGNGVSYANGLLLQHNSSGGLISVQHAGDALSLGTNGTTSRLTVTSAGAVSINIPTAAVALSVSGAASSYTGVFSASTTATSSFGINLKAGTNSGDTCFLAQNASAGTTYFNIRGDGAFAFNNQTPVLTPTGYGSPTAGSLVANFPGTGATLAQCGGMISTLVIALKNFGILAA